MDRCNNAASLEQWLDAFWYLDSTRCVVPGSEIDLRPLQQQPAGVSLRTKLSHVVAQWLSLPTKEQKRSICYPIGLLLFYYITYWRRDWNELLDVWNIMLDLRPHDGIPKETRNRFDPNQVDPMTLSLLQDALIRITQGHAELEHASLVQLTIQVDFSRPWPGDDVCEVWISVLGESSWHPPPSHDPLVTIGLIQLLTLEAFHAPKWSLLPAFDSPAMAALVYHLSLAMTWWAVHKRCWSIVRKMFLIWIAPHRHLMHEASESVLTILKLQDRFKSYLTRSSQRSFISRSPDTYAHDVLRLCCVWGQIRNQSNRLASSLIVKLPLFDAQVLALAWNCLLYLCHEKMYRGLPQVEQMLVALSHYHRFQGGLTRSQVEQAWSVLATLVPEFIPQELINLEAKSPDEWNSHYQARLSPDVKEIICNSFDFNQVLRSDLMASLCRRLDRIRTSHYFCYRRLTFPYFPSFTMLNTMFDIAHQSLPNVCHVCRVALIKRLTCSRCMSIHYCSKSCQKSDWSKHKMYCITVDQ